eukprot:jgi/Ulvmu1/6917/UM031_0125.1
MIRCSRMLSLCLLNSSNSGSSAGASVLLRPFASLGKSEILALIKDLRAQTGAPLGDVRSALEETGYDLDAAFDALRKRGAAAAAKKADRSATQGLVTVTSEGAKAALVEINCETDFVARNDSFQGLLPIVAKAALQQPQSSGHALVDIDALQSYSIGQQTVADAVKEVAGTVRENVVLRAAAALSSSGYVATYVHNVLAPGCGTMCSAVALEHDSLDLSKDVPQAVAEFGKHVSMQVVAMDPLSIGREGIPAELLEHERTLLTEQARSQNPKNEDVLKRMVKGRLEKFYELHSLLDQKFILEDKASVAQVLKGIEKEIGKGLRIAAFACLKIGQPPRVASA